jgi:hypothetical protein
MAKVGKDPLFNEREERDFADHLIYMAEIGYGYSKSSIQIMAKQYTMWLKKIDNKIRRINQVK